MSGGVEVSGLYSDFNDGGGGGGGGFFMGVIVGIVVVGVVVFLVFIGGFVFWMFCCCCCGKDCGQYNNFMILMIFMGGDKDVYQVVELLYLIYLNDQ